MNKMKLISLLLVLSMVFSMMVFPVAAVEETENTEESTETTEATEEVASEECPEHPGEVWTEVAAADWAAGGALETGHYKLAESFQLSDPLTVAADQTVCIDLAGFDITASGTDNERVLVVDAGGAVVLMDSTATEVDGVYTSGKLTGGYSLATSATDPAHGANVYVSGTFTMYSGTIANGTISANTYKGVTLGGNMYGAEGSVINIKGGLVTGGKVDRSSYSKAENGGANIFTAGILNISGGTVSDGYIDNYDNSAKTYNYNYLYGGNIFINSTGSLVMSGGTVANGWVNNAFATASTAKVTVRAYGGNIYNDGNITLSGGVITGGKSIGSFTAYAETAPETAIASCAGNVFNGGTITMTGGEISDGTTVLDLNGIGTGGNIQNGGTINISGGIISGGTAYYRGGNFYNSGTITLSGDAVVTGGTLTDTTYTAAYGGNYYGSGNLYIYDRAVVKDGSAYNGGNLHTATSNGDIFMYGGAVYGGTCVKYGPDVRIFNNANCRLFVYGGYIRHINDGGTSNVIELYNGVIGFNPSGLTTTDGATTLMSCAHCTALAGSYYNVWHTEGTCATCGHTYAEYGTGKNYTSTDTKHLTLGGAHTYVDGACSVCGKTAPAEHTVACSHGCENVTWVEWDGVTVENGGHYYLADNMAMPAMIVLEETKICLDLNGYTLTAPPTARAFTTSQSSTLIMMDSSAENTGLLRSFSLPVNMHGANLRASIGTSIYLYDLTVADGLTAGTEDSNRGGNIYAVGKGTVLEINNAKILDGSMVDTGGAQRGGNICAYQNATVIVKGEDALISGGDAYGEYQNCYGGNIHFGQGGYLYIYDGTITDGVAKNGANVSLVNGKEENSQKGYMYMYGGKIGGNGVLDNGKICTASGLRVAQNSSYQSDLFVFGGEILGEIDAGGTLADICIYAGVLEQNPTTFDDGLSALSDCACFSYDEETGLYTVGHLGGTDTCDNCARNDGGYANGYSQAHTYALTAAHTYTDSCVCDNCQVVTAKLNDVEYTELSAALAAAEAADTVTLMKDTFVVGDVDIYTTLDLNGKSLEASGRVSAENSDAVITDSVGTGTTTGSEVVMGEHNDQLAISAENNGVYTFESVDIVQKVANIEDAEGNTVVGQKSVKFYIDKAAENTLLDNAIQNGDNIEIRITVKWGENQSHSFTYTDDLVSQYLAAWDTKIFTCQITGLDVLGEYTICADVKANGVVVEAYDFTPKA